MTGDKSWRRVERGGRALGETLHAANHRRRSLRSVEVFKWGRLVIIADAPTANACLQGYHATNECESHLTGTRTQVNMTWPESNESSQVTCWTAFY